VLEKQFRPPVGKVCIEVPAGLIDEGETPEEAAVRELKEETGYVGEVSVSSPLMFHGNVPLPLSYIWLTRAFQIQDSAPQASRCATSLSTCRNLRTKIQYRNWKPQNSSRHSRFP
jgi:8-oxo-dGTP pyrophosphatase MutT (NUDIX family)